MRIAYFTNTYARASDTFIRNEVVELRTRGHSVSTFSIRKPDEAASPGGDVAKERATTCYILATSKLTLTSVILRTVLTRPGPVARAFVLAMKTSPEGIRARMMQVFYFLEAVFLASRIRQLGIEILHNHIAENSATVAMLASMISGVPFSMTVHGPGIFFHPRKWALGEKIARASFTACISDFCKSQCMLFSDRSHWSKLKVIRCGVGRHFEDAESRAIPAAPRIVFIGRLCDEKGLPLLLDAVATLNRSGCRCELSIIGDGPLKAFAERFIERHGLSSSVDLLGWRGSEAVAEALVHARALVLPSFAEGLPVVIMEAMALGRPVVTTAIAGIPELVESGCNGWLIPAGSSDALARAIREVVESSVDALDTMGRSGMLAVRERHSLTLEVDKLESNLIEAARRPVLANAAGSNEVALLSESD